MTDGPANRRRQAAGYEPNTPRCCTCVKYRPARVVQGRPEQPWCNGGRFTVEAHGCCDKWKSKKGEVLG